MCWADLVVGGHGLAPHGVVRCCQARRQRSMIARPVYSREKTHRPTGGQVQVRVKLPSDPLLEFWHFCNAIAEALCPLAKHQAGIECIIGKRITREVSLTVSTDRSERWPLHMGLQRVLLSDDNRTLGEMLLNAPEAADVVAELPLEVPPRRDVVEVPSIIDLDDEDRLAFEELLQDYPALRSLLSPQNEETFLSAYHDIPRRPSWVPVFQTTNDRNRREREQDDVREHHRQALQTEFAEGRVTAVNGRWLRRIC